MVITDFEEVYRLNVCHMHTGGSSNTYKTHNIAIVPSTCCSYGGDYDLGWELRQSYLSKLRLVSASTKRNDIPEYCALRSLALWDTSR